MFDIDRYLAYRDSLLADKVCYGENGTHLLTLPAGRMVVLSDGSNPSPQQADSGRLAGSLCSTSLCTCRAQPWLEGTELLQRLSYLCREPKLGQCGSVRAHARIHDCRGHHHRETAPGQEQCCSGARGPSRCCACCRQAG